MNALPPDFGIYALQDHSGNICYIGMTADGFYRRINNRHVTGSESRSHKFSHGYNTGRMWRDQKDQSLDATTAKSLRNAFARKYCRATFVVLSSASLQELRKLEADVLDLAPAEMLLWGDKRSFLSLKEPPTLVDKLVEELHYSLDQRASIGRQRKLYFLN